MDIRALPRLNARHRPTAPALIHETHRLTWADLGAVCDSVAAELDRLGCAANDRVTMLARNSIASACVSWSVIASERCLVPLDHRTDELTLGRILAELDPSVVLSDHDVTAKVASAWEGPDTSASRVVDVGGCAQLDVLVRAKSPGPRLAPAAEDALILYTSGTTGQPKGVRLSSDALGATALLNAVGLGLRGDDLGLVYVPMSHKGGMNQLKIHAAVGAGVVVMHGFDVEQVCATIEQEPASTPAAAPTCGW